MIVAPKSETVAFSSKGQIVIPRNLRKEIQRDRRGHPRVIEATPDGILIKPVTAKFIRSLRGKYKDRPLMETLKEGKREGEGKNKMASRGFGFVGCDGYSSKMEPRRGGS